MNMFPHSKYESHFLQSVCFGIIVISSAKTDVLRKDRQVGTNHE